MSQNEVDQGRRQLHRRPVHGDPAVRFAGPPPIGGVPGNDSPRFHTEPHGKRWHPSSQPAIPAGGVPLGDTPSSLSGGHRPGKLQPPLAQPHTARPAQGVGRHPLQPVSTAEVAELSARNKSLDWLVTPHPSASDLLRQPRQPGPHRGGHGLRLGVPGDGEHHRAIRRHLDAQGAAPRAHVDSPRPFLRHRKGRDRLLDGSAHGAFVSPGDDTRSVRGPVSRPITQEVRAAGRSPRPPPEAGAHACSSPWPSAAR